MNWKSSSWALAGALVALLASSPVEAGEWSSTQIRGTVNFLEIVAPIFGEKGSVGASPSMNFGIAWRQSDPDEFGDPGEDGLKPMGAFVTVGWDIASLFDFNWAQLAGGVTYEELTQLGVGLWVGNATRTSVDEETSESETWVVPGLDMKVKVLLGVGIEGDPE